MLVVQQERRDLAHCALSWADAPAQALLLTPEPSLQQITLQLQGYDQMDSRAACGQP
jgi:hypothetical protein